MRAPLGVVAATAALCAALSACSSSPDLGAKASSSEADATASAAGSSAVGGSGATLSSADWVSKVNAICDAGTSQSDKLGDFPGDPTQATADQLAKMATYLDAQNKILQTEITQIRALPKPSPSNAKADEALADLDKGITGIKSAIAAANSGNVAAFLTAFESFSTNLDAANDAATAGGLASCGD